MQVLGASNCSYLSRYTPSRQESPKVTLKFRTELGFAFLQVWGGARNMLTPEALASVAEALQRAGGPRIPLNFQSTAAAHNPSVKQQGVMPQTQIRNPQTLAFLEMLGLPYNLDHRAPRQPGVHSFCALSLLVSVTLFSAGFPPYEDWCSGTRLSSRRPHVILTIKIHMGSVVLFFCSR